MVKKVVDTWKTKQWYSVMAPDAFGSKQIGEVIASEDKKLKDRIVSIGLDEITGDFNQTYTTVSFRIIAVNGKTATTRFVGHELLSSYVKTFIKRHKTMIDDIIDVTTSDNQHVRIKLIVFAGAKVARGVEAQIRIMLREDVKGRVSQMTLDQFLKELFFQKFAQKLTPPLKKLAPIRRIEVRKTEVEETFAKQ